MNAKQKALAAAKRMSSTSRPVQTVKTWAKHMRAVISEAAMAGADPRALELLEHEQAAHDGFMRAMRKIGGGE